MLNIALAGAPAPARPAGLAGFLPALPILRLRLTMRLLRAAALPAVKGAMLRGGFGYAFRQAACPSACRGETSHCVAARPCAYRLVFETPHPPGVTHLHDLRDVPRPFVIEPPLDPRTRYAAGAALEFQLVLIGRGIDALPYFLISFERLGRLGLGRDQAPARLERVEALGPWQPTGPVIYQDGRAGGGVSLPLIEAETVADRAAALPADLRLTIATPLRIKHGGAVLRALDMPALVRAVAWRLNALATFHGAGPWPIEWRALAEQARDIRVERARVRWMDQARVAYQDATPHEMPMGGIVGSAVLRDVPAHLRALLLLGSLVHVGKACVFGQGAYEVEGV